MPNWCSTNLTVTGPAEEMDRFLAGLKKEGNEHRLIDSYLPCPEELTETVDGWSSDEDEQKKREELYAKNIEKYGYKSWYDWQYAVWGTKWGDCDTRFVQSFVRGENKVAQWNYMTAWGPMTNGWLKVSEMFPNLVFEFEHDEEGGFFAGYELIRNGEVWEEMYEPSGYPEEIDWDDADSVDKFYTWKDEQNEKCAQEMERTKQEVGI